MITDFLRTTRSKEELKHALEVLREFKSNESQDEWLAIPFAAWAKLEQMEEFLAHLIEGAPLADDTVEYMKRSKLAVSRALRNPARIEDAGGPRLDRIVGLEQERQAWKHKHRQTPGLPAAAAIGGAS